MAVVHKVRNGSNGPHLLEHYLEKKENVADKKRVATINIVGCCILYAGVTFWQTQNSAIGMHGVIAQIQVMVSVFLTVSVPKKGYITAVAINAAQSLILMPRVFLYGDSYAAPGLVIPLCKIITITIISLFAKRLLYKLHETREQKTELLVLYEELTATEEELSHQNKLLIEYNRVMAEKEKQLNFLALFDVLTELPNRKMIIDRLELLIKLAMQKPMSFAVVLIDLDDFKMVNGSMGHHVGDFLLQDISTKLKRKIHAEDLLGRLGGDEFALVIQRELNEDEIGEYVEQLKDVFANPFMVARTEFMIGASMGIALYPQDGDTAMELLKCADTAMYKAKEAGKNSTRFFNHRMQADILKKVEFENNLLSSIANAELFLVFQPQYFSDNKKIRGFEALIRWRSPKLGLVDPRQLIPVAEETGFIIPMGEWILRRACEQFQTLQGLYPYEGIVSVNISAMQIMNPAFVPMVRDILHETGLAGKYLEIEITESIFISSMNYVIEVLNALRALGVRIALDDFGTGYSSLNYLQLLPIDTLKIDKTFIDQIERRHAKKQMIGSIISLVHQLDITVIAEGVETEKQLHYLQEHSCDCIQGFLWGKPLGADALVQLLNQTEAAEVV
jgi:diguanylate cyclase (GGDEF)-like protein